MRKLLTLTAAAAVAAMFTLAQPLAAATLVVNDDAAGNTDETSPCNDGDAAPDHTTIQAAVSAASDGDTILVCPGTYVENVDVSTDNLTIRSTASLISTGASGAAVTTVDGIGANDEVFDVAADGVTIRGFEIINGGGDGGIGFSGDDNVFANNDVHDNSLYGIVAFDLTLPFDVSDSTDVRSDNNLITNNHIHDNLRSGILIGANGNVGNMVHQNQIFDNDTGGGFVNMELVNNFQGEVTHNNIYSTSRTIRSGILLFNWRDDVFTGSNTVTKNNVHEADGGSGGGHSLAGIELLSWTAGGIVHGLGCNSANQDDNDIVRNETHDNPGSGIFLWAITDTAACVGKTATVDGNLVKRNSTHDNGADGISLFLTADNNEIVFNNTDDNDRDGINLDDQFSTRTGNGADGNLIENNRADTNGRDGIRIDAASTGNEITRNHMNGNTEHDAHDDSTDGGPGGTDNDWDLVKRTRNKCTTSTPGALCVD